MHASLVVTAKGLPLGLAAIKFWTRKNFKRTSEKGKHINRTRVPIEEKESFRWLKNLSQSAELLDNPKRCVHIGDRESDIYELFCAAHEINTHFLIRTCVDRLAGDGDSTVADEMDAIKVKGLHRIKVKDKKGNDSIAILAIKYHRIVKKCKGKNIASYMLRISKLGGYLARASDPPPGNVVMLQGLMRLIDIEYGFNLAMKLAGN